MINVMELKMSKLFHHGRTKQDFKLCGRVELYVFGQLTCSSKFKSPRHRQTIMANWYRQNPNLTKRQHYFIIKYIDE